MFTNSVYINQQMHIYKYVQSYIISYTINLLPGDSHLGDYHQEVLLQQYN
jgi:hypothetical protein